MASVQLSIRAGVSHGIFPTAKGAEAFSAYAIASAKGLVPEMEKAARQTLDHPMTFEVLGEGLRLFEGWALHDLVNLRKRYRDNLVSCFKSFLKTRESRFQIWTPCASYTHQSSGHNSYGKGSNSRSRGYNSYGKDSNSGSSGYNSYRKCSNSGSYSISYLPMSNTNSPLPSWLVELYQKHLDQSQEAFSKPLFDPRSIRGEYLSALQAHINSHSCVSCTKVHTEKGETFCKDLKDRLVQALNEVCPTSIFRRNYGSLSMYVS
jgi:hypothetical protein